jgi:hypothetical protein
MSQRVLYLLCVFLILSAGNAFAASQLYGVVSGGESGEADAGKLVLIDSYTGVTTEIGQTGLTSLSALGYDVANRRLIAGALSGRIYEVNTGTAETTRLVKFLRTDPTPPSGVMVAGPLYLVSLDFHPGTNDLYAVLQDGLSYFLARLDLSAVDSEGGLAVHLIGTIGSSNYAYGSIGYPVPFGFSNVFGIAFDPASGELYGGGIDLTANSPLPRKVRIATTSGASPFAMDVGSAPEGIRSFVRAAAYDPETGESVWSGIRLTASGALENVLFTWQGIRGPFGLSGQVSGLAFVPQIPGNLSERPPTIDSFTPTGGNTGILVTIRGTGYTANGVSVLTEVRFNGVPSLREAVVVSDSMLRVLAPDAPSGPITIVTTVGEVSGGTFRRAELLVLDTEANQGLPTYPLVRGKDTLVRFFTGSNQAQSPVTFETAKLTVTWPGGAVSEHQPILYSQIFNNTEITQDSRRNINFYLPGEAVGALGTHRFDLEVRAPSGNSDVPGPVILNRSFEAFFQDWPGDLRILVVLAGILQGDQFTGPDEGSMEGIAEVFAELSRVHPVRKGISQLGQNSEAGVRYEISPKAIPLDGPSNPKLVIEQWESELEALLDEYNEENPDQAEYVAAFIADEHILLRLGTSVPVANGASIQNGRVSVSRVSDAVDSATTNTAIHEIGHNMRRVGEQSPNYDHVDDKNHSINREFPPGADPNTVRAWNVPGRYSIAETGTGQSYGPSNLPVSIMYKEKSEERHRDGGIFFEEFEYQKLLKSQLYGRLPVRAYPVKPYEIESPALFTLIAKVNPEGVAEIRQSYASSRGKKITETDPNSPCILCFLNADSRIIREEPIAVPEGFRKQGKDVSGDLAASPAMYVVRPLPENATQVQLKCRDRVLWWVRKKAMRPQVSIISPEGGETFKAEETTVIRWTAKGAEGATLRFNVSYSPDGKRWLPVAAGIQENHVRLRFAYAPGSGHARVRVMASDGFIAGQAVSKPFTVGNKLPWVSIIRPTPKAIFLEYDSVVLEALAFDLERGVLDGNEVSWASSRDGELGFGRVRALRPGRLRPGQHILRVKVAEGSRLVEKKVSITVLSDSDRDGLPDIWERTHAGHDARNPYDAESDMDGDGLSNLDEFRLGTDPNNPDSDGDGVRDGTEIRRGTNPLDGKSSGMKWMGLAEAMVRDPRTWAAGALIAISGFLVGRLLRKGETRI